MEIFVKDGDIIPQEEWFATISKLQEQTTQSTKAQLQEAIIKAVQDRIPDEPFGVFLSGGVDSAFITFLLHKAGAKFTCYTVGTELAKDLPYAKQLTQELNIPHKVKVLTNQDVESIIKTIAPWYLNDKRLENENLAVLFGVAATEYAAAQLALEDNIHILFGGLGSEEIFAGYQRHEKADDINAECWNGLKGMWQRDLIRDVVLCKKLGLDARTPLLDPNVIKAAMGIDGSKKIVNNQKKVILREIAKDLGLSDTFTQRKKLGAQYGSKIDHAIKKLAKKNGTPLKSDYLKQL